MTAESWRNELRHPSPARELKPVVRPLPRGTTAEIGFGNGESLAMLAELGFAPLYGYELDTERVAQARRHLEGNGTEAQLYAADATAMTEVPSGSLALVVAQSAIQYFRLSPVAQTVRRVLEPGGHLVVFVARPSFYVAPRHLSAALRSRRPWWLVSYPRSFLRTIVFALTGRQPTFGAAAPEIGWSKRTARRFADAAELDVTRLEKTTRTRYLIVFRRR